MKLQLSALLSTLALATAAHADAPTEVKRVLKETTTIVALELTPKTVFCTDRGYGNVQLKVSVPDLDWLAHFDHRVAGEGLPCITGGRCTGDNIPEKLLDPSERVVTAPVKVILTELITVDAAKRECTHRLTEEIRALVRGHKFTHFRGNEAAPLDFEKCQKLIASGQLN